MVQIRPARPDEGDALGALAMRAYVAGGHLDPDEPYAREVADGRTRLTQADVLVLIDGDALIGTATVCPSTSPLAEIARGAEVEVRYLAIDPAHWGRGHARTLMARVEELAHEQGVDSVVLCVIEINEAGHRLYTSLGFDRMPDRDWEPVPGKMLRAYRKELAR